MKRILLALCLVPAICSAEYFNLNTGRGVGGGITESGLKAYCSQKGRTVAELVAEWKANKIVVLRTNVLWKNYKQEKAFLAACKANQMTTLWCFDYAPEGIEHTIDPAIWNKLRAAFWDPEPYDHFWRARQMVAELAKGLNWKAPQEFILQLINNFKYRNSDYLIACWGFAGNDCENAIDCIYRNYVGEPPGVLDSSTYGGNCQIIEQGQRSGQTQRATLAGIGISIGSDANFAYNTARFEERERAAWGPTGRWIDNAHHAYWDKNDFDNGRPYLGDCGSLSAPARIYAEFDVNLDRLPGRTDLLNATPPWADVVCYWNLVTGKNALWGNQAAKSIIVRKAASMAVAVE